MATKTKSAAPAVLKSGFEEDLMSLSQDPNDTQLPSKSNKEFILQKIIKQFEKARKDYPGGFVPRKEAPKLIGYLYSAGYLANCDSLKIGVKDSFYVKRQKCYFLDAYRDWVISRVEV